METRCWNTSHQPVYWAAAKPGCTGTETLTHSNDVCIYMHGNCNVFGPCSLLSFSSHFYCLFLFLSSHPFCLCGSDPFYVLSLCCLLRDISERMWTVNHPCLVSTYLQYKKSIDSQIILLHTGITILSLSASVCVLFFSALWDWRLKVCYPPLHSAFHPWLHPSIWCIPVSPVCQWAEGAGPLTLREPAADQPWEALALSSESDKATGLSCQTKPVKCKTNLPFEYL